MSTSVKVTATVSCLAIMASFTLFSADAAPLKSARVTQIVKDVKLLPDQGAAKPAVVNDDVPERAAVKTGVESRTELTFSDQTLARLGPNTIFASAGSRAVDLGSGAILLHVPKNSGGAEIKTALVTAAVTGTTLALETFNFPGKLGPVAASDIKSDARYKVTVLEGEVKVCRTDRPKECVILKGGQALVGGPNGFGGAPVSFDVAGWMANNILVAGFHPLNSTLLAALGLDRSNLAFGQQALSRAPAGVDAGNVNGAAVGVLNPSNISANDRDVSDNQNRETICHNGNTLILPKKAAEKHLANHPSDYRGACR